MEQHAIEHTRRGNVSGLSFDSTFYFLSNTSYVFIRGCGRDVRIRITLPAAEGFIKERMMILTATSSFRGICICHKIYESLIGQEASIGLYKRVFGQVGAEDRPKYLST